MKQKNRLQGLKDSDLRLEGKENAHLLGKRRKDGGLA
jgi:hypothetical protein